MRSNIFVKHLDLANNQILYGSLFFISLLINLSDCTSIPDPPPPDSSIYLEKSLSDLVNGSIKRYEAYDVKTEDGYWYYRFYHVVVSAYLDPDDQILYDDIGNTYPVKYESEFKNSYWIWENKDFDPQKQYRIKLILREAYYLSEIQSSEIYIKLIEGIRLYSDIVKEEKEKKERDRKTVVELDYENAINSEGISALVKYIQSYRGWDWDDYFNEDSYAEIARRLTNDRNMKFNRIGKIKNPYAFGKNTIYFYPYYIKVNQWMENGNLLCFLDDDVFIIERVPDIKNIGEFIRNAYLQYNGTGTLTFVDGRKEVIALFDLIYSFD